MPGRLTCEYQAGEEIQAGEQTLMPFSKVWRFQAPGGRFSMTWNRPAAVLARAASGEEQILPIPDLTRRIIFSLLGVCVGAALLAGILSKLKKERI
jgi:hypothetical protein